MPVRKGTFDYVSLKKYDSMMGKCYRLSDSSYPSNGGVGVKVCSAWIKDIDAFRQWLRGQLVAMKIREEEFVARARFYKLTRNDRAGHFTPENCSIVTGQRISRLVAGRQNLIVESAEGEQLTI